MTKNAKALVLLLFTSFIPVALFAQDFKQIRKGVEYAEVTREIGKLPVRINLLRLDLSRVRLDVVHAADRAVGLETTSSIARRKNALAAVNAGYFRTGDGPWAGEAAGILQIDGKLLSESANNRAALFIRNGRKRTAIDFGRLFLTSLMKLEPRGRGRLSLLLNFSGINRERKEDELVLFTPEFGPSTLTQADAVEIVLDKKGRVRQVLDGRGNTNIPRDGAVVAASGKLRSQLAQLVRVGDRIRIEKFSASVDNEPVPAKVIFNAEDIVAGNPQIINNGKADVAWEQEKSGRPHVETKHPRTAAALLKDGKFLLVTVDGRSGASAGIDLYELAELLLELGAVEAINLDGGGSTAMFLDGKIVNTPSDKTGERMVSDALIVTPRKR